MELTFVKPHASIISLPRKGLTLGKLTVITGRNGSGKSQLLEAIELGCVTTDVASGQQVYRRDWQSFVPADVSAISNRQPRQDRIQLYGKLQATRNNYLQVFAVAHQNNLDISGITTRSDLLALSVSEIASRMGEPEAAKSVWEQLRNADDADNHNLRYGPGKDVYRILNPLANSLGKSLLELTAKDVDRDVLTTWGMAPFQATFVQPFVDYRNLHIANALARLQAVDGSQFTYLDSEAFPAKYGEEPWVVLNKALASVDLPFTINAPKLNDPHEEYIPRLTKRGSGAELPFSRLSSGEKILRLCSPFVWGLTSTDVHD